MATIKDSANWASHQAYPSDMSMTWDKIELRSQLRIAFQKGARWQKSQMFKDAFVDNYVVHDGRIELEGDPLPSLDPILLLPYPQFKPGDKVRIVVLKAEEESK